MKVYYNGKHVKTVPRKFSGLALSNRFKNATSKRLSADERFLLEVELFRRTCGNKFERELIRGLEFVRAELVKTNELGIYYVLVFGKLRVECSKSLYDLAPVKGVSFRTV